MIQPGGSSNTGSHSLLLDLRTSAKLENLSRRGDEIQPAMTLLGASFPSLTCSKSIYIGTIGSVSSSHSFNSVSFKLKLADCSNKLTIKTQVNDLRRLAGKS